MPAWSPDASQLLFVSNDHGGHDDLYMANADGSQIHQLTRQPRNEFFNILRRNGIETAIAYYDDLLRSEPNTHLFRDVNAILGYANRIARRGDASHALELLQFSVRAFPQSAAAYAQLGNALRASGRNREAIAAYRAGLALDPNDPLIAAALREQSIQ